MRILINRWFNYIKLSSGWHTNTRNFVVQRCQPCRAFVYGRHFQRWHRTTNFNDSPRRHRRLHVHSTQWRGTSLSYGTRYNCGRRCNYGELQQRHPLIMHLKWDENQPHLAKVSECHWSIPRKSFPKLLIRPNQRQSSDLPPPFENTFHLIPLFIVSWAPTSTLDSSNDLNYGVGSEWKLKVRGQVLMILVPGVEVPNLRLEFQFRVSFSSPSQFLFPLKTTLSVTASRSTTWTVIDLLCLRKPFDVLSQERKKLFLCKFQLRRVRERELTFLEFLQWSKLFNRLRGFISHPAAATSRHLCRLVLKHLTSSWWSDKL